MRHALLGCVLVAALAVPGAALTAGSTKSAATTYTIFAGEQKEIPGGFKKLPATLNQFMPSKLVIAAGDKVTFSSATFHTVTYNPKPIAPFVPDPAKGTYTGISDAAGTPFYFDGRGKLIYNLQAFGPFGPKTISGKTPASSGILSPPSEKAPPATVTYTFPKPGTFKLFCTFHPGMKETVVVKPTGSAVPKTPAQVQAAALAAQTAGWAKGKVLEASVKLPPNTVAMGIGGSVSLLAFRPKVLNVKAGTTVTFVNKAPSEPHNLVFGPPKYIEQFAKKTDLTPQGPTGPNQVSPVFPYGTDAKPYTYEGATMHGNGFFGTELTSGAPIGLPRSSKVTFATPGTFKYFCLLHGPDMGGTIVVK
jgi:plastocyanin